MKATLPHRPPRNTARTQVGGDDIVPETAEEEARRESRPRGVFDVQSPAPPPVPRSARPSSIFFGSDDGNLPDFSSPASVGSPRHLSSFAAPSSPALLSPATAQAGTLLYRMASANGDGPYTNTPRK